MCKTHTVGPRHPLLVRIFVPFLSSRPHDLHVVTEVHLFPAFYPVRTAPLQNLHDIIYSLSFFLQIDLSLSKNPKTASNSRLLQSPKPRFDPKKPSSPPPNRSDCSFEISNRMEPHRLDLSPDRETSSMSGWEGWRSNLWEVEEDAGHRAEECSIRQCSSLVRGIGFRERDLVQESRWKRHLRSAPKGWFPCARAFDACENSKSYE